MPKKLSIRSNCWLSSSSIESVAGSEKYILAQLIVSTDVRRTMWCDVRRWQMTGQQGRQCEGLDTPRWQYCWLVFTSFYCFALFGVFNLQQQVVFFLVQQVRFCIFTCDWPITINFAFSSAIGRSQLSLSDSKTKLMKFLCCRQHIQFSSHDKINDLAAAR